MVTELDTNRTMLVNVRGDLQREYQTGLFNVCFKYNDSVKIICSYHIGYFMNISFRSLKKKKTDE